MQIFVFQELSFFPIKQWVAACDIFYCLLTYAYIFVSRHEAMLKM